MRSKPLPRPQLCIVTALEIIGFDDPTLPEGRQRQVLDCVDKHLGDPEFNKSYKVHSSITGPRIVHVARVQRSGMLPFRVLLDLLHLQIDLVPLKMLLRGGITIGEAAVRDTLVFGSAMSLAERLRDEIADVPRVIVDPRVLVDVESRPELRAEQHTSMVELGFLHELLRQDADGFWFMDYLSASRSEYDNLADYLTFLRDHRHLVQRKLDAAKTFDRTTRAITWSWRYHEMVLDEREQQGIDVADLRIPATSPLVYRFSPFAKFLDD